MIQPWKKIASKFIGDFRIFKLRSDIKHDCFPVTQGPYTRDYLAHPVRLDAQSRLGSLLHSIPITRPLLHRGDNTHTQR